MLVKVILKGKQCSALVTLRVSRYHLNNEIGHCFAFMRLLCIFETMPLIFKNEDTIYYL